MNQDKPRCKRCGRPLKDPVSIAAGMGPYCRGLSQTHKNARSGQASGRGRGVQTAGRENGNDMAIANIRPIWRVYDIPDGNIEGALAIHRERFGEPKAIVLWLGVSDEIYGRAKRWVAIVIKHRKVLDGQVWVI